jgi:hypothetical protein
LVDRPETHIFLFVEKETSLCDFRGRSILVGLKNQKKNPDLPTLILKTMQSETPIYFFWP